MKEIENGIKCEKSKPYQDTLTKIKQTLENDRYRFKLLESSEEPTAYSWLTTTPLIEHVFYLDKTTFWDSIRIRYDIPLKYLHQDVFAGVKIAVGHQKFPTELIK